MERSESEGRQSRNLSVFLDHRRHAPAPATVTGTAEMKHRQDHATADRAGSGEDNTDSGTSQEEAGFQLGEDGCTQSTD